MTSAIGGARVRHLPGCACHTTPSSRHFPFPFLSAVSTCTIVDWIGDLLPPFPALLTLLFPALCFCLGQGLPLSSDIFTSAPHATANQTSPITSSNPISDLPIPAHLTPNLKMPRLLTSFSYLTSPCLYPLPSSPHSPGCHVLQVGCHASRRASRLLIRPVNDTCPDTCPDTYFEALRPLRHRRTSFAIVYIDNYNHSSPSRLKWQLCSSVHSSHQFGRTSLPL